MAKPFAFLGKQREADARSGPRLGRLRLRFGALRDELGQFGAPRLLALLCLRWGRRQGPMTRATLFEAGTGPQIGGATVATQYGLDPLLATDGRHQHARGSPRLAGLMVGASLRFSPTDDRSHRHNTPLPGGAGRSAKRQARDIFWTLVRLSP
jgi:hypothetical protein